MNVYSICARLFLRALPTEPQRCMAMVNATDLRLEAVLTEKNRQSFIERFKLYKSPKYSEEASKAAVLVPLCTYKGELGLLYTLRSTKLSSNRGQVSFPGGMHDKSDVDFRETALRETWEELRIPKDRIDVWTSGNVVGKKGVSVTPVFGYIGDVDPKELRINPDEVEEAFVVSLRDLCDPDLFRFTRFRENYTLPVYLGGKYRVWGFTAALTHMALSALIPTVYKHKIILLPRFHPTTKAKDDTRAP
ncbi:hypothetical protein KM043_018306 [Ampulex compressa]|nr:hypothetical protein KM043_018306 [Ampulex compressa]